MASSSAAETTILYEVLGIRNRDSFDKEYRYERKTDTNCRHWNVRVIAENTPVRPQSLLFEMERSFRIQLRVTQTHLVFLRN